MKPLIINVGNNKTLSKIVQELLFEAGYKWAIGAIDGKIFSNIEAEVIETTDRGTLLFTSRLESYHNEFRHPLINASTEFDKLIELLEKKEIIVEDVIYERSGARASGYHGRISSDKKYITIDCSKVSREKVKEVYEKMFLTD